MFKFFKGKSDAESPPDIGKEDLYDPEKDTGENSDDNVDSGVDDSVKESLKSLKKSNDNFISKKGDNNGNNYQINLEVGKLNERINGMNELMKGFNERFMNIVQQTGELRAMILDNQKSMIKSSEDALKAVDIVKDVKPERLRTDYQKVEMKVVGFGEKLEANRIYMENIMNELKDLKNKAQLFIGTDGLLKLNEDIKKDLFEIQKLDSRVRLNADKTEQLFIELKNNFSKSLKIDEVVNSLNSNVLNMQKDLQKLKIDHSLFIKQDDLDNLRKSSDNRLKIVEDSYSKVDKMKEENERISTLIEEILLVERRNEEDIANLAIIKGNQNVKKISDYENRLLMMLNVIDRLASEIKKIKVYTHFVESPSKDPSKELNLNNDINLEKEEKNYLDDIDKNNEPSESKLSQNPAIQTSKISEPMTMKYSDDYDKTSNLSSNSNDKPAINNPIKDKKDLRETKISLNLPNPLYKSKGFDNLDDKKIIQEIESNSSVQPKIESKKVDKRKDKIETEIKINDLLLNGGYCLVNNDFPNAFRIYKEVSSIYNPIYDSNKKMYFKIIRFYHNIMKIYNNKSKEGSDEKIVHFGDPVSK